MIFSPYFSAQTQGQTVLASIKHQKILKYGRNGLILLPRQGKKSATFHICSDHFTDADYLIPPVVAASSDVKFKRILNRNAVPSIYPSPTFDKVKSKQSEYEVVKKSGVKLPPFPKPSYALVDVDVKMKDSIKRRRKKTVDKLSLSRVSQSFTDLSFWLDFSSF